MTVAEIFSLAMFGSACVFLLAGFPVAFTLAGNALLFAGIGVLAGNFDASFLGAYPQRIFGIMTNDVLIAVPLFIVMGVMLERSKVAEELLDTMGMLFGRVRGGLGISVSVVGALMAASTGIVGATVVTMGLLALPTMLRRGYDPALACGSICAAGTLGQIIPPSIVLVLLGDVVSAAYQTAQLNQGIFAPESVSVADLFAGGLVPGLVLVGMYILYQILMAWLRPETSPAVPRDVGGPEGAAFVLKVLNALVPPIVLIVAVLGSILGGVATPTEAAAVGAIGALLLAGHRLNAGRGQAVLVGAFSLIAILVLTAFVDLRLAREHIPPSGQAGIALAALLCAGIVWGTAVALRRVHASGILRDVARSTARITSMVFVIVIGAQLFSLVFRGFGGDDVVHELLGGLPGGTFGAVVVVMAVMFILGFFLDFIEITFVVVPIVAPVLLTMGIDPVWLGIMMALNLQTSFLTPPFGFSLFYLRGVAPGRVTTMNIYKGAVPFVVIQLICLAMVAWFPGLATWLPKAVFG